MNDMICSAEKTKVLFVGTFANRRSKIHQNNLNMDINICDENIKESSSEKLLGLILNNTLTWKNYLYGNEDYEGLLKQLSKRVGILKKIRNYMPVEKFKTIISGLFTSKLIYCITVWGGIWGLPSQRNHERRNMAITKQDMIKLQVLQNKTLRLISGLGYDVSTKDLLSSCNEISVHQLIVYHTACQVYKIEKSKLPVYHHKRLFSKLSRICNVTRYTDKVINRIDFDLSVARSSFFYQAPQVWCSLPNYVKSAPTLPQFKKKCKRWIKNNVLIIP